MKELGARVNINVDIGTPSETPQIASDDLKMIEMHELMQTYYQYALLKQLKGRSIKLFKTTRFYRRVNSTTRHRICPR